MLLQLKNIIKDFRLDRHQNFRALNDITISFDKGEFVSILGPSGCGKSTLLNLIAGLDTPTNGELIIDGRSTKRFKQNDWDLYRKNNIGFIFQQFNLVEHLTAVENVEIVMTLIGLSKKQRHERALSLLKQVGLEKHATHRPSELSGGQKQRVAIARALANNPEIILADEPTGALDTKTGFQIMELLKEIAKDKLIIMVTHNRQLAYDYSTRVVKMLDGVIQDDEMIQPKNDDVKNHSLNKKDRSMPFIEALKLSLRNMKSKIGRVLITAIAGSIGIAGITLVMGLGNGANLFIAEQITHFGSSNVLSVSITEEIDGIIEEITDPAAFDYLKDIKNVVGIRPNLDTTSLKLFSDDSALDTQINTLAPHDYQTFLTKFTLGNLPMNENEVLINRALARRIIDINGFEKEDYQRVLNTVVKANVNIGMSFNRDFTVVGIIDEIDIDQPFFYLNYEDLENFYRSINIPMQGTFYDIVTEKISSYHVIIDEPEHTVSVFHHINGGSSLFSSDVGAKAISFSMIFYTAFNTVILIVQAVMILFLVVALVVSSILIAIVLFSSILERKTEIGILKAIGARNKDIMRVFESEAFLLGLFAGLIGIGLAFTLAPLLEIIARQFIDFDLSGIINIPLVAPLPGTNIPIPGLYLIILVLISVIVSLIAGYLPSKKATKMQVIDALRDE